MSEIKGRIGGEARLALIFLLYCIKVKYDSF